MLHDEHSVRYSDTVQSARCDPDHLQPDGYFRAHAKERLIADDLQDVGALLKGSSAG
jgi:hypothetical protein